MKIYGSMEGRQFIKDAMELEERGLAPRIRLYRMSADGLNVLTETTVKMLGYTDIRTVEAYAIDKCGDGHYCAKLFSTQYGRNILESTFDFIVEDDEEDDEDEDITFINKQLDINKQLIEQIIGVSPKGQSDN